MEALSATGGGGGSVGGTSSLISGGGSGGAVGFLGGSERRLTPRSVDRILGFGARGGLVLGRWTLDDEETEVSGDKRGLGEVGGGDGGRFGEEESVEALRGVKSEWLV